MQPKKASSEFGFHSHPVHFFLLDNYGIILYSI
jgi:hypothetical protein